MKTIRIPFPIGGQRHMEPSVGWPQLHMFTTFVQTWNDTVTDTASRATRRTRCRSIFEPMTTSAMLYLTTEAPGMYPEGTHRNIVVHRREFASRFIKRTLPQIASDLGLKTMDLANQIERVDPKRRRWAMGLDLYEEWAAEGTLSLDKNLFTWLDDRLPLDQQNKRPYLLAPVRYYTPQELAKREVHVDSHGLLCRLRDNRLVPLDTRHMVANPFGKGWCICVLDGKGKFYVAKAISLKKGGLDDWKSDWKFGAILGASKAPTTKASFFLKSHRGRKKQHSSFTEGAGVQFAGCIIVINGVLKVVTPKTGHYKSGKAEVKRFLAWLKEKKVSVGGTLVLKEDFQRERRNYLHPIKKVSYEIDDAERYEEKVFELLVSGHGIMVETYYCLMNWSPPPSATI